MLSETCLKKEKQDKTQMKGGRTEPGFERGRAIEYTAQKQTACRPGPLQKNKKRVVSDLINN